MTQRKKKGTTFFLNGEELKTRSYWNFFSFHDVEKNKTKREENKQKEMISNHCSFLFDLFKEHVEGAGLFAEVADGDAGALEVLLDGTGTVTLDEASPFGEHVAFGDLDEVDVVLSAEGRDELLVAFLFAVFGEDAQVSGAGVEGAGNLGDTTDEAVDFDGLLDDNAEGLFDIFGFDVGVVGGSGGDVLLDDGFGGGFSGH